MLWTVTLSAAPGPGKGCGAPRLTLGYSSPRRSVTYIKERYGPYITGAYFVLKQGGSVKYDGKGVRMGVGSGREAGELLSKPGAPPSDGLMSV